MGDIYKIPITKMKHAYAQYCHEDNFGYMIKFFNLITAEDLDLTEIINLDLMFPPIYVGIFPALREGGWIKIGNLEVKNFKVPRFKSGLPDRYGNVNNWWLIDGEKEISLGKKLPEKYKNLEHKAGWSYHDVVKRIKNKGKIPYKAWE